jgi:hypothetical protein
MNRVLASLLFIFSAAPVAMGQCAIQPIKPIPPIGCKDVTPQCVSDGNGQSHWNWVCVPTNTGKDTSNDRAWKPRTPAASTPSGATQDTNRAAPRDPLNSPYQGFATPQLSIGVPLADMDPGEQHATEELRAIAASIKSCPSSIPPEVVNPVYAQEGFEDVYGPPLNVVWNVEPHPSTRARYAGSIEFSEPSYYKLPVDDAYCNKPKINKSECRRMWVIGTQLYKRQLDHPLQFRYEFDVTSQGLEFLRAFKKTHQTDDEAWVGGGLDSDGCAFKAVKSVLESSDGNTRSSAIEGAGVSPLVKQNDEQTQGQGSTTINKAPLEISGVGIGMAREIVLSGLAGRYKLTKEDLGGGASQLEVWLVEEKASSTSADFWEIAFTDGKVGSVITRLSPTLHGDAVGLAQQLFAELYPRADVDSGQVAKFLGTRRITVDVELGQMSSGKSNEETMRFQFPNGRIFEIKIAAPLTSAPSVNTSDFRSQ